MESFSEDTLYNITSYLTSHDIVNLALTCKHFGGKPAGVSADVSSKKRKVKTNTANVESSSERQWPLMEEMAKRRVDDTKKNTNWQEKWKGTDAYNLITSRKNTDSWIRIDNCIQKISSELVFNRFFGSGGGGVGYMGKNPSCIEMKPAGEVIPDGHMVNSIAICQDIMTEGRHYAEFTVLQEGWIAPGIMYSITNGHDASLVKDISLYQDRGWKGTLQSYRQLCERQEWNEDRYPYRSHEFFGEDYLNWTPGQRIAPEGILFQPKGTVIGILLDFDEDILLMFVDGVIHAEFCGGHSGGQYSWATLISRTNGDRGIVKVERGIPPPPPRRGRTVPSKNSLPIF